MRAREQNREHRARGLALKSGLLICGPSTLNIGEFWPPFIRAMLFQLSWHGYHVLRLTLGLTLGIPLWNQLLKL